MSITKNTKWRTNPTRVSTSTVKKSAAAISPRWALMKVFQLVFLLRSGAGSMPWCDRIRRTVLRAISWPRWRRHLGRGQRFEPNP